jgi:hypothetical protein
MSSGLGGNAIWTYPDGTRLLHHRCPRPRWPSFAIVSGPLRDSILENPLSWSGGQEGLLVALVPIADIDRFRSPTQGSLTELTQGFTAPPRPPQTGQLARNPPVKIRMSRTDRECDLRSVRLAGITTLGVGPFVAAAFFGAALAVVFAARTTARRDRRPG